MLKLKKQTKKKNSFKERVLYVVRKIPRGETLSYAQVAKIAGSPKGARAVGNIMKSNFDKSVPCHRVIKSDGTAGDYNGGGTKKKIEILKREGVTKFKVESKKQKV